MALPTTGVGVQVYILSRFHDSASTFRPQSLGFCVPSGQDSAILDLKNGFSAPYAQTTSVVASFLLRLR
jgi:hypothetical protein